MWKHTSEKIALSFLTQATQKLLSAPQSCFFEIFQQQSVKNCVVCDAPLIAMRHKWSIFTTKT
jgi:hypothetical protein